MDKKLFLKCFSLPAILICGSLGFAGYMAWKEVQINSLLIEKAIAGNPVAVKILAKYEKPWRIDERLLIEALNNNPNAIEAINLNIIEGEVK